MDNFLTIKAFNRDYTLRQSGRLRIGRSHKNHIIIPDPTASRKHAVISWESYYPKITDRGSSAGTIVDGKRVSYCYFSSHHQIEIGNTILTAELAIAAADTTTQKLTLPKLTESEDALLPSLDDSDEVTLFGESGAKEIFGYLETNQDLRRFLVKLEMECRTGTLNFTKNSSTATIIYGLGRIKGACFKEYGGYHALQAICSLKKVSYHFSSSMNVGEYSLDASPMFYLRQLSKQATLRRSRPKG